MELDPGLATRLLRRISDGDAAAREELLPLLYQELKRVAAGCMQRERADHTLQPTALVHEAWLRVLGGERAPDWGGRAHFVRVAARAMRHVLVDHARARAADKRGGDRQAVPLDQVVASFEERSLDIQGLDEALEKLGRSDEELARLVELRYFGGLTIEATAEIMGVSTPTVERRWRVARMWLRRELGEASD